MVTDLALEETVGMVDVKYLNNYLTISCLDLIIE